MFLPFSIIKHPDLPEAFKDVIGGEKLSNDGNGSSPKGIGKDIGRIKRRKLIKQS